MIDKTLILIKNILAQHLENFFELAETAVVLNSLEQTDEEKMLGLNQNKMVISLINIEQETSQRYTSVDAENFGVNNQKNPFNLDVLFSACFDDYEEALKFLTVTISFFEANSSFTSSTNSSIPDGISKLNFDMKSLSYDEMHSLWSAMGTKYQPSIIYKVRVTRAQFPEIKNIKQA